MYKNEIELCDKFGKALLASDGRFSVDGRFSLERIINECKKYKERFKKHFSWKYDYWTHVRINGSMHLL